MFGISPIGFSERATHEGIRDISVPVTHCSTIICVRSTLDDEIATY